LKLKSEELNTSTEHAKEQGKVIEELKLENQQTENLLKEATENLKEKISTVSELGAVLKKQLETSENMLKMKVSELSKINEEHLNDSKVRNSTIHKLEEQIKERDSEINKLKQELATLKEEIIKENATAKEQHSKEIEEKICLLKETEERLKEKDLNVKQLKNDIEAQKEELDRKVADILAQQEKTQSKFACKTHTHIYSQRYITVTPTELNSHWTFCPTLNQLNTPDSYLNYLLLNCCTKEHLLVNISGYLSYASLLI